MTGNPAHWGVDFGHYLRFELEAEERHELIDGDIVAMGGAPRRHNLLCERIRDALRPSLGDGPCTRRAHFVGDDASSLEALELTGRVSAAGS